MDWSTPFNRCVECDEIITNPVCSHCLARIMRTVLSKHDLKLSHNIQGAEIDGETKCLFCGQGIGLCAHCFSQDVYELIQKDYPQLADIFLRQFNFELIKNAERKIEL